jgi:hypothetical protein
MRGSCDDGGSSDKECERYVDREEWLGRYEGRWAGGLLVVGC